MGSCRCGTFTCSKDPSWGTNISVVDSTLVFLIYFCLRKKIYMKTKYPFEIWIDTNM